MTFNKRLKSFKDCTLNSAIYNVYYNEEIDDEIVYLESKDGLDFTGNIFRIAEELSSEEYNNLKIHVHAKKQVIPKIKRLIKNYDLNIHKIIEKEAIATKVLEKAKYIFTDSGIRPKYVKRPGQIFINTWHGTPLKLMGIDNIAEEHTIANVQHTLMSSDYLLYPNEYMCEKMMSAYMIDEIYSGKILFEGYPRNSVFFDDIRRYEIKSKLGYVNKEIFIYMPTFKGILMDRKDNEQKNMIENFLFDLDKKLNDNQIFLVKLHVLNQSKIDFTKFNHIHTFPEDYEIYDVLNIADVLVTDYSSVFFDFANTRKKIVLFNYDEEEYMKDRGTYFALEELPFPKVQTTNDLINELNLGKNYDDSNLINKFCQYDRPNAVKYLCKHIIKGKKICKEKKIDVNKSNILIYAGLFFNSELSSSLIDFLSKLNTNDFNFYISFKQWDKNIINNHEKIFKSIPKGIKYMPLRFYFNPTISEKRAFNKYFNSNKCEKCPLILYDSFKRLVDRQYPNFPFDCVIDFDGSGDIESWMFSNVSAKKIIWVHNDVPKNIKNYQFKELYSSFDYIIVDSPELIASITRIIGKNDNILVNKTEEYKNIIYNAFSKT